MPPMKPAPSARGATASTGHDSRALLEQATALRTAGDLRGAEHALQIILRQDPDHALALNGLGNLAVAARRLDLAVDYHSRAVKAAPKDPGLRNDLANSHLLAGDPQAALPHLRKALDRSPRLRPALLNLARAQRSLNEPGKSLATLEKLAASTPADDVAGRTDIDLERAMTLAQTGHGSDATVLFRHVLQARPADPRALDGLATSHRARGDDHDLALFDAALAGADLSPLQRAVAHRSRGKTLEDLGRYHDAFAAYQAANQASARPFDMQRHEAFIVATQRTFTGSFLAGRVQAGEASEQPVFVVGLPRSGTTLVEQILACHPDVAGLGELGDIERLYKAATGEEVVSPFGPERIAALAPEKLRDVARQYLASLARRGGTRKRVINKMPHNFLVLGFINLLFPKARIIHCTRDPLDVCVSLFTHHISPEHAYSNDLAALGAYHRSYQRLLGHWAEVLPEGMMLEVRYEDVVASLEPAARRMVGHLRLPWHDACLEFHNSRRVVETPSQWQVRQPIYGSSVGRWRRFESQLAPLRAALAANPHAISRPEPRST